MSFNHALEHWERAKKDPNSDDKHKLSIAENLARELRDTKQLLKEAMNIIENENEGRIKVDEGSLLDRLRKAIL